MPITSITATTLLIPKITRTIITIITAITPTRTDKRLTDKRLIGYWILRMISIIYSAQKRRTISRFKLLIIATISTT